MRQPKQFHVDVGDISIAVNEWAGDGDPVLLLHATGFHSRCWDQVVKHLPGRHIYSADLRFHGASGDSGEVDWNLMCEDMHRVLEQLDLYNVTGVGHSIGGHIMTRIAAWSPHRFSRLLLIDPVIMSPRRLAEIAARAQQYSAADHPVSKRKNSWSGPDEMFQRFSNRTPFNTWRQDVLRDYCDHALTPNGAQGNYQLACNPLQEAAVYMHHGDGDIYAELPTLQVPVTLLRAPPGDSEQMDFSTSPTWPDLAGILPRCEEIYLPHMNHFIPMQDPSLVAKYLLTGQ